jgi:hypothetical protein
VKVISQSAERVVGNVVEFVKMIARRSYSGERVGNRAEEAATRLEAMAN